MLPNNKILLAYTPYSLLLSTDHRYLRKVDCSQHSSSQKIIFNWSACSGDKTRPAGRLGRQAWSIDAAALAANIFRQTTTELTFTTRQAVRAIYQSIYNMISMI
jgi:hypothetical protein